MRIACVLLILAACGGGPRPPAPAPATPKAGSASTTPTVVKPRAPAGDPVIAAVVDGVPITVARLDREIRERGTVQLDTITDPDLRAYTLATERQRILPDVIDQQLLVAAATRAKTEVAESEIDAGLTAIKTQNNLTDAQLAELLKQRGFTMDDYRRDLREQLLVQRYIVRLNTGQPAELAAKQLVAKLRATAKITIALPASTPPKVIANNLDASALVVPADLEKTLGRAFELGPLDPAQPDFDSRHFRAIGHGEPSDFSYRVWKQAGAALEQTWKDLPARLPNVKTTKDVGDESFTANEAQLAGVGFIDRKASVVVLVICGGELCKTPAEVLALAKLVHGRLDRLKTP